MKILDKIVRRLSNLELYPTKIQDGLLHHWMGYWAPSTQLKNESYNEAVDPPDMKNFGMTIVTIDGMQRVVARPTFVSYAPQASPPESE